MSKKYDVTLTGSVQTKGTHLYLVYNHYDCIKKKYVPTWKSMGLSVGEKKAVIEKKKRAMLTELEAREVRYRKGGADPDDYPLVEFLNDWINSVQSHRLQVSTLQGYKRLANGKIAAYFGEKFTLGDITTASMMDFFEHLREEGDKEITIKHYSTFIHTALEYAVKREIFDYNPMIRVERPKAEKTEADHFTKEESRELIRFAEDDPIYIPIVLGLYYGMRRSELLGLTWDCIDFENKTIRIEKKVIQVFMDGKNKEIISDKMKTDASKRTLPLIPRVEEILLEHKKRQEANRRMFRKGYSTKYLDMVCTNEVGELFKPNYITTHFDVFLEKHGLRDLRFHCLRHTCASLLLDAGVDMTKIQKWLGHGSLQTTANIYAHAEYKSKLETADVMGNIFGGEG